MFERIERQHGLRIGTLLSVIACDSPAVQCAVPFASGHGDGTPFLAPLVVLVALAYCLMRVVLKAVTNEPSSATTEVPREPSAPQRVR